MQLDGTIDGSCSNISVVQWNPLTTERSLHNDVQKGLTTYILITLYQLYQALIRKMMIMAWKCIFINHV